MIGSSADVIITEPPKCMLDRLLKGKLFYNLRKKKDKYAQIIGYTTSKQDRFSFHLI